MQLEGAIDATTHIAYQKELGVSDGVEQCTIAKGFLDFEVHSPEQPHREYSNSDNYVTNAKYNNNRKKKYWDGSLVENRSGMS